jgi:hypothetical protein
MSYFLPTYLNVHIKRYRCQNCLEVFSQTFDSIQPNQHQTKRFRKYLYELCKETTIQDIFLRISSSAFCMAVGRMEDAKQSIGCFHSATDWLVS